MKAKPLSFIFILAITFQIFSQTEFNPDQRLKELSGKTENIGIAAGYAIDGKIQWSGANGFICEDRQTPFSTTTLTRIASIAKNFTAVAIMQLVEKNKIKLDSPIEKFLPNLPQDKKHITVKQLLAHTAGISQYQGNKEIENTIHYETLQDAMEVFITRPLLFKPGSKYFYTSYGYVILGRIIEEVSDMSYEDYMKTHIFDVAGMSNTGIENIDEQYDNKSCLYHKKRRKAKEGNQNDLSNRVPGGGFYSTVEDVLKFGMALLDEKFISQETLEIMIEPEPVEYDGNKYSLGWFLYGPEPYENLVIGHSGGQTGCTSQLMIVPKSKTVLVVLSNTSGNYPDVATFAINLTAYSEKK